MCNEVLISTCSSLPEGHWALSNYVRNELKVAIFMFRFYKTIYNPNELPIQLPREYNFNFVTLKMNLVQCFLLPCVCMATESKLNSFFPLEKRVRYSHTYIYCWSQILAIELKSFVMRTDFGLWLRFRANAKHAENLSDFIFTFFFCGTSSSHSLYILSFISKMNAEYTYAVSMYLLA